jgi:hypothetical protein
VDGGEGGGLLDPACGSDGVAGWDVGFGGAGQTDTVDDPRRLAAVLPAQLGDQPGSGSVTAVRIGVESIGLDAVPADELHGAVFGMPQRVALGFGSPEIGPHLSVEAPVPRADDDPRRNSPSVLPDRQHFGGIEEPVAVEETVGDVARVEKSAPGGLRDRRSVERL